VVDGVAETGVVRLDLIACLEEAAFRWVAALGVLVTPAAGERFVSSHLDAVGPGERRNRMGHAIARCSIDALVWHCPVVCRAKLWRRAIPVSAWFVGGHPCVSAVARRIARECTQLGERQNCPSEQTGSLQCSER
jgi:hypothetical protein